MFLPYVTAVFVHFHETDWPVHRCHGFALSRAGARRARNKPKPETSGAWTALFAGAGSAAWRTCGATCARTRARSRTCAPCAPSAPPSRAASTATCAPCTTWTRARRTARRSRSSRTCPRDRSARRRGRREDLAARRPPREERPQPRDRRQDSILGGAKSSVVAAFCEPSCAGYDLLLGYEHEHLWAVGARAPEGRSGKREGQDQQERGAAWVGEDACARRHVCGVCGRGFRLANDLRRHLRIHTGEKPFCCPHCPYRASQKQSVNRHVRTVHADLMLLERGPPARPPAARTVGQRCQGHGLCLSLVSSACPASEE
ncbi:hypothetical protein C7M84_018586 [Penaeus vannamei]|uniref:C2H2-type domain-containing protein n=1 Tax=Penaeus vannamei TaxID=6689 RepID=A0A423SGZ4_PENVA|nr:hypothetical protein C7M84_018586 [Penaeus vannamei]